MAISWMTVLKMVPWGDVIESAPKLASGARNLWSNMASKKPVAPEAAQPADHASGAEWTLPELQAHTQALRMQVHELREQALRRDEQLQACAQLIASLAEQNEKLVARQAVLHRRQWLVAAALMALLVAAIALAWR